MTAYPLSGADSQYKRGSYLRLPNILTFARQTQTIPHIRHLLHHVGVHLDFRAPFAGCLAVQRALEAGGVRFIPAANGDGPGVRLAKDADD